ncbi:MAG: hypothetical protein HY964_02035 [Ignavibacteriales bacterium]|nr:hypothetical protein [Ignavibacteriales bacterium]
MRNGPITKMWGVDENNFYAVGYRGTIIHFQNGTWSKIESGTDTDLLDVWGTPDGSTVWACGWVDFKPTVLLRIQNNQAQKVYQDPFPFIQREDSIAGILTSVWTPNDKRLYLLSGYGIYKCPPNTMGEGKRNSYSPDFFPGFPYRMRGNGDNDIVLVGNHAMIVHYNGYTFRYFEEQREENIFLLSVAQKKNIIVTVGEKYDMINGKGVAIIGKRGTV